MNVELADAGVGDRPMDTGQIIHRPLECRADVRQDDRGSVMVEFHQFTKMIYVHAAVLMRSNDLAPSTQRTEQPLQ